ncbi:MAG: calcium-binding protein [Burkholderiaceae bacterium]
MKKILLIALTSTALLASLNSHAQSKAERAQEMKEKLTERFNAADADHDGRLTRLEAEGKMPRVAKSFDAIDVQKRGYVTIDQIAAFAAQQMKKRKGRKSNADDE